MYFSNAPFHVFQRKFTTLHMFISTLDKSPFKYVITCPISIIWITFKLFDWSLAMNQNVRKHPNYLWTTFLEWKECISIRRAIFTLRKVTMSSNFFFYYGLLLRGVRNEIWSLTTSRFFGIGKIQQSIIGSNEAVS